MHVTMVLYGKDGECLLVIHCLVAVMVDEKYSLTVMVVVVAGMHCTKNY